MISPHKNIFITNMDPIINRYDDKCNLEIDGKLYNIIGGKYDSVFLFTERINFIRKCIEKGHTSNYNELANCYINKLSYKCQYTKEMEDKLKEIIEKSLMIK